MNQAFDEQGIERARAKSSSNRSGLSVTFKDRRLHHRTVQSSAPCSTMQTRSSAPAPAPAPIAAAAAAGAAPPVRLMYAAPVHKLSLLVAARAWPLAKRTYRFIDLILARRRKGQLAVEPSGSGPRHRLPDLPDEIWHAVKRFAAIELYLEEQDRFVFGLHGGSDDGLWDELADPEGFDFIDRIGRARLDFGHLSDCYNCQSLMFEQRGMIRTFNEYSQVRCVQFCAGNVCPRVCGELKISSARLADKAPSLPPNQEIVSMLSDHGLKIACYHLVRDKTYEHADLDTDLDGETLLAFADRTAPAGSSLRPLAIIYGVVAPAEQETIAAQGSPLPASANARFTRLCELIPADTKASHKKKHGTQGSRTSEDSKTPGWTVLEVARKV